jgi:hypothetical protein
MLLLIIFLTGCTTMPMYDSYGNYRGSTPTWDAGTMAGAGTGAILGTLAGAAFGNPLGGAVMGAAIGGIMPPIRASEPIYVPQYSVPAHQYRQQYYPQQQYNYYPQPQYNYYYPAPMYR